MPRCENLWLDLRSDAQARDVRGSLGAGRAGAGTPAKVPVDRAAQDGLKFSACLPVGLAERVLATRLRDDDAVAWVSARPEGPARSVIF